MERRQQERASAALRLAIARAGGVSALAKILGVTASAVSQWEVCPAARVKAVEAATGIPRQDLRPDYHGAGEGGA